MATFTLPLGQTEAAPEKPLDASVAGVVYPVLPTSPTDAMWGEETPPNGTTVYEAGEDDTGYVLWVRINGTWRGTWMGD